jgi:hypothetical protein
MTILTRADETGTMSATYDETVKDRRLWVENCGWLLSQTREGIRKLRLCNDPNFVEIEFDSGASKKVCIECDSYLAIIKDVIKAI